MSDAKPIRLRVAAIATTAAIASLLGAAAFAAPSTGAAEPNAYQIQWAPIGQPAVEGALYAGEDCANPQGPGGSCAGIEVTLSREGALIASASTPVDIEENGFKRTAVGLKLGSGPRPGDIATLLQNGTEVAKTTYDGYPTFTGLTCGSNTVSGNLGDIYTKLVLSELTSSPQPITTAGEITQSGTSYSAHFPITFSTSEDAIVGEAYETPSSLPDGNTLTIISSPEISTCAPAPTVQAPKDTDGDGIPDSADQCPTEAGPAPSGCPAPAKDAPIAACDVYWTKPRQTLTVPAAVGILSNDEDPSHSPLTAHVDRINFGLSTHSYAVNPTTGAMQFRPGTQTKSWVAEITYHDTDATGLPSAATSIRVYVQPTKPSARLLPSPLIASTSRAAARRARYHGRHAGRPLTQCYAP